MRYFVMALVFLALTVPAAAQQHTGPWTASMFRISRCDAQLNPTTHYAGYRPGFYPYGRPWYWGDVYGYGYYQPPVSTTSPTMYVDFTNITHKVMTEIDWGLVANRNLVAEVRDVGKFSPGVEIKHSYGISENVFPLQTGLPLCAALRVKFEDGSHVRNPNLPHGRRQMYASPPPGAGAPATPMP